MIAYDELQLMKKPGNRFWFKLHFLFGLSVVRVYKVSILLRLRFLIFLLFVDTRYAGYAVTHLLLAGWQV